VDADPADPAAWLEATAAAAGRLVGAPA